jgi:hypothetical protein
MHTVGRTPYAHGAATCDYFANQLLCVQGKNWQAVLGTILAIVGAAILFLV